MTTLTDRLIHQKNIRGDAVAVVSDELSLSWAELCDLSLRTSTWLRGQQIAKGDRVALLCGNRPAFLVAWFGLANIGAITVSLNTALVGDGLCYAINQSDAKAILIERAIYDTMRVDIEPVLAGRTLLVFDGEEDLFANARMVTSDAPYDGDGSDPLTIIYTSGTTGPPKGVLNCHEAYLASGRWMSEFLAITPADRIMIFLPLFHINPQIYAVASALEVGCTLVLRPNFSVSSFFDDARRFGCTMFTYVGTVLAMLASRLHEADFDHKLTRCVGGGCPPEVWRTMQERFGIVPHELYGMTEVGGWVTGNSAKDYRLGSCGKTRPDVEVEIFDEHDRPVPAGTPGEIVVRPREPFTLLLGYWANAEATWASSRNFWFHTGDAGTKDEDGFLYFLGRLKEIIRRGGENISPFELETALLFHPDIADAAVVGVPDAIFGEEIKAVVVARRAIEPRQIPAFLQGRVPAYMFPRYVQFVSAIPKTETQKIQRRQLQESTAGTIDLKDIDHALNA